MLICVVRNSYLQIITDDVVTCYHRKYKVLGKELYFLNMLSGHATALYGIALGAYGILVMIIQ